MASPVRYAVVGMGHIAQAAVLPAFAHAKRNSRLTAIVSDDATKRRELGRRYRLEATYRYEEYDRCLQNVDAVYIALPNSQHADYTIRAANAGVHVLCEKPMAVTVSECEEMIAACRRNGVKLVVAYRLHFEEINLRAVDLVRRGRIGEPKFFNSSFSMTVRRGDIRTKRGAKLAEIDESTAAILRFEGDRIASFVTSFNAHDVGAYRIVGTKGQLQVDPAYEYAEGLAYRLSVNGKSERKRIGKRDQFAPELLHFSDCIRKNREPEPSGEEGLQDVRIVQALYESAETGKAVRIPPFAERKRPTGKQRITRPGVKKPPLVKVESASED
jgi:glucose-fructose oxidoreductase